MYILCTLFTTLSCQSNLQRSNRTPHQKIEPYTLKDKSHFFIYRPTEKSSLLLTGGSSEQNVYKTKENTSSTDKESSQLPPYVYEIVAGVAGAGAVIITTVSIKNYLKKRNAGRLSQGKGGETRLPDRSQSLISRGASSKISEHSVSGGDLESGGSKKEVAVVVEQVATPKFVEYRAQLLSGLDVDELGRRGDEFEIKVFQDQENLLSKIRETVNRVQIVELHVIDGDVGELDFGSDIVAEDKRLFYDVGGEKTYFGARQWILSPKVLGTQFIKDGEDKKTYVGGAVAKGVFDDRNMLSQGELIHADGTKFSGFFILFPIFFLLF